MTTAVESNKVTQSLLDKMNGSKSGSKDSIQDAQDRFMTLLVTQMKNQDPLNPMDNAQVTSQLAQLSTVTGINQLNESLQSLMVQSQSSQMLQASNMIGRVVTLEGNGLQLSNGKASMGMMLPSAADGVTVTIKNAAGSPVRDIVLGRQGAGEKFLQWDGNSNDGTAMADGNYTFEISASLAGKPVLASPISFDTVSSVSTNASTGVQLNLMMSGAKGLNVVKEIY